MTALRSLDRSYDLSEAWRLRQVRLLEVTGPPPLDGLRHALGGAPSVRDELLTPLRALAPQGISIELDTVGGSEGALEQLRREAYEVLLVHHVVPGLDAPELLRALRSAEGTEEVVVLCGSAEPPLVRECVALGADAFAVPSVPTDAFETLAHVVWRAAERAEMCRQLQRLDAQRRRRVQREAGESTDHQHALEQIVAGLGEQDTGDAPTDPDARSDASRQALKTQYQQLLRLYVVMGSGHLSEEVAHWSLCLAGARVSVAEFFQLHLECVAQLKRALRTRGTRHCDRRADLLLIELLAHLARHHEQPARPVDSGAVSGPADRCPPFSSAAAAARKPVS